VGLVAIVFACVVPGLLGPSGGYAQGVQSVVFEKTYGDKIEVRYYLVSAEVDQVYFVRLQFSEDGGISFSDAMSVSGDVGRVLGSGWKTVQWDALADRESIETNRLVVKVVASGARNLGGVFSDVFLGSSSVRHQNNGMTFWGGLSVYRFKNPVFKSALALQNITTKAGYGAGLRYVYLPILIDAAYAQEDYEVSEHSVSKTTVRLHAISMGASVAVLPLLRYIVPTVGGGYQVAWLESDAGGTGGKTTVASVSAPYWEVGLNVPVTPGLVLGGCYREALSMASLSRGPQRAWYQWSLSAGFHVGNP
jgi:hypothetical protein